MRIRTESYQFIQKNDKNQKQIDCIYCHQTHFAKDMPYKICPNVVPFLSRIRENTEFECSICQGDGCYDEEINIRRHIPKQNQQSSISEVQITNTSKPAYCYDRTIIYQQQSQRLFAKCQQCNGTGKIVRMLTCCKNGCSRCNNTCHQVNSLWMKYKIQEDVQSKVLLCRICNKTGTEIDSITADCNHNFHRICIRNLEIRRLKCPICRDAGIVVEINFPKIISLIEESSQEDDYINLGQSQ